jgi:hypothetical protein
MVSRKGADTVGELFSTAVGAVSQPHELAANSAHAAVGNRRYEFANSIGAFLAHFWTPLKTPRFAISFCSKT